MPKIFLKSVRRQAEQGTEGSTALNEENKNTTIGNKKRYDLSAHDDWSVVSELSFVTRWDLGKIPRGNPYVDGRRTLGRGPKLLPKIKSSVWRKENTSIFGSLEPPMAIETREGNKSIVCSHCSKSFLNKWTYDDHMLIHLKQNARPFACPKCPRTFSDRSNMLSHQRTMAHHDWKWICQQCTKPFSEPKYLKRHCNRFHPQRP